MMFNKLYEWYGWEVLIHIITAILILYIFFVMYKQNFNVQLNELILFGILLTLMIIVHQNIYSRAEKNKRNFHLNFH